VLFLIGLGIALNSWLGWLGTLAGAAAGLALAAVGLLPMNDPEKHTRAAITFFRTGLAMVCLYGLAFAFQPAGQRVIPPEASILSLLAAASYASFLTLSRPKTKEEAEEYLDPNGESERPRVWILPVVEWLVFFQRLAGRS